MLETSELVYGEVAISPDGATLVLFRLDATGQQLLGSASTPLPDLADDGIPALVDQTVGLLYDEPPPASTDPVTPDPDPIENPPGTEPNPPPGETDEPQELVWGLHRPIPPWKIAGVAASGVLAITGLVIWQVAAARVAPGGPIRSEIEKEFEADPNLDPNTDDVCEEAAADGMSPNQEVIALCDRADSTRRLGFAGVGIMVVGLAATAAFTTLLFVRREPSKGKRAQLRPVLGGGRSSGFVGVRGRF